MPHFMLSVIDRETSSATPQEMEAIDAFNARLIEDGHWVQAAGLAHPELALVVDGREARDEVLPGPFAVTEEYVSGFWIVTAADRDEAASLALAGSRACGRRVELREFLGG